MTRQKTSFFYFFTKLKTYHLSYFYSDFLEKLKSSLNLWRFKSCTYAIWVINIHQQYNSVTCMWLSDFNKRHLRKQGLLWTDFFVAILKIIETDQFSQFNLHLTWLTLFPGEFQLLQLLTHCAYFMLSYSWLIMQLTLWGIKLHWLSINLCFLLYKIFFSPQWMINGSNKTLLATGFWLNDKQ